MNVKTEAKLSVRRAEGKPEVEAGDEAASDGTIKGRFKGTIEAEGEKCFQTSRQLTTLRAKKT